MLFKQVIVGDSPHIDAFGLSIAFETKKNKIWREAVFFKKKDDGHVIANTLRRLADQIERQEKQE